MMFTISLKIKNLMIVKEFDNTATNLKFHYRSGDYNHVSFDYYVNDI